MSRTYYVCGPMTGRPQFNIPLFNRVTAVLREGGRTVINPAEEDTEDMRRLALESKDGNLQSLETATEETWGDVLSRDVKLIADTITDIVLLPEWEDSAGAKLETTLGLIKKHRFWLWNGHGIFAASATELITKLATALKKGYGYETRRWAQGEGEERPASPADIRAQEQAETYSPIFGNRA